MLTKCIGPRLDDMDDPAPVPNKRDKRVRYREIGSESAVATRPYQLLA